MVSSPFSLSAGSLFLLGLASSAAAAPNYKLVEKWQGKNFLDYFNFHVGSDPTNGFVTYLDQRSAEDAGLVKFTDSGSIYLGVDHETKLSSSGPGRNSVRVGTKKYYDKSLVVADIAHMPGSVCGTWPAFWSVGRNWPGDGEIDILEGVNLQEHNEVVMHTSGTCSIKDEGMTGVVNATGCGEELGPVGCVIEGHKGSYGTPFNKQGGGVYAMEWTEEHLKIWFFPRHSIPSSISEGKPDVTEFGMPMALVQDGCDVANSFKPQSFVFDVTFCGDWAGGVFGDSGCPLSSSDSFQSCADFVAHHPAAFKETYWEINSVKVYQTGVKGIEDTPPDSTGGTSVVSTIPATATHAPEQTTVIETLASQAATSKASTTRGPATHASAVIETSPLHASVSEVSTTHAPATHASAVIESSASHGSVSKVPATHSTESAVDTETAASHAPASNVGVTHDTATHMPSVTAAAVEEAASEGWHAITPATAVEVSSAAGASSATGPPAGAFSASDTSSASPSGTTPPAGSFPTTSSQKPSTTRYVTKLVTSTTTLCSLEAPSAPASHIAETPAETVAAPANPNPESSATSHVAKAAESATEQQSTNHAKPTTSTSHVAEAPATTETVAKPIDSESSATPHSVKAAENTLEHQSTSHAKPTTTPAAAQITEAAAREVRNTESSAHASPNDPDESGTVQVLSKVIPAPSHHVGSSSALPTSTAHRSQTSKPVIPRPTSSAAASGSVFPGASSSAVSPVFTGAAERMSTQFSSIFIAFAFAMMA